MTITVTTSDFARMGASKKAISIYSVSSEIITFDYPQMEFSIRLGKKVVYDHLDLGQVIKYFEGI